MAMGHTNTNQYEGLNQYTTIQKKQQQHKYNRSKSIQNIGRRRHTEHPYQLKYLKHSPSSVDKDNKTTFCRNTYST